MYYIRIDIKSYHIVSKIESKNYESNQRWRIEGVN